MVVGRPRIATVDVGAPAIVIHDAVTGFVAGARSGTLMHRNGGMVDVLLLDVVEEAHAIVLGGVGGCGGGGDVERGLAPFPARLAGLVGCGHGGVERGEVAHHALVLLLLVGVHGLRMLAQVVEAGELLGAMASKGAFAGVFPDGDK